MFSSNTSQVSGDTKYIEDYFSTFLYSGTGASQTITNGIDLSTKGGLVWIKDRASTAGPYHALFDTNRGAGNVISSNSTDATNAFGSASSLLTSFGTSGFSLGTDSYQWVNKNTNSYVSWSIAKSPKFFDVVTYTGNGTNGRTVAHSLGSTPGCIIVKRTDAANGWAVYHRAMNASPQDYMMRLNATDAAFTTTPSRWNNTLPTSTEFTLSGNDEVNGSGATYVAYLFAHNAGGFGLTGTDNVISCGSYGSNTTDVNLGYEPQWIMIKNTTSGIAYAGWAVFDNMRGLSMVSTSNPALLANSSTAEYGTYNGAEDYLTPTATGFKLGAGTTLVGGAGSSGTWIYIAIRRGPMKVPTSGTEVYGQQLNVALPTFSFPPDMVLELSRASDPTYGQWVSDRLRGSNQILQTFSTNAESSGSPFAAFNQGGKQTTWGDGWSSGYIVNGFRRAPSFFDEVCYTGNGTAQNITHNLGVAPELMIVKKRSSGTNRPWRVGTGNGTTYMALNSTDASASSSDPWNDTAPTASVFTVGIENATNESSATFVAYLFATCAGVSKVGTFTGNGSSQTINCGFTGGARFVMIKATSTTGDWMVADSARGIVSGNDPYLELNNTNAEVTGEDWLDTDSTGFVVNQVSSSNANTNGVTYIYLAIA